MWEVMSSVVDRIRRHAPIKLDSLALVDGYDHEAAQNCLTRSQNVPKTKVERAKLVEITENRKGILGTENID
jgi:hypothetical protein